MGPSLLFLNQVNLLTGGLALLEQVRFTRLPAVTNSDGLMDTEMFLGALKTYGQMAEEIERLKQENSKVMTE